jgi:hypothetical protein
MMSWRSSHRIVAIQRKEDGEEQPIHILLILPSCNAILLRGRRAEYISRLFYVRRIFRGLHCQEAVA